MRHEALDGRPSTARERRAALSGPLQEGCSVVATGLLGALLSQRAMAPFSSLLGRRRDERTRLAEQRYQSLFEHHPDAVFALDRQGCFSAANGVCQAVIGYTSGELVELAGFPTVVTAEDRAHAQQALQDVLKGLTVQTVLSLQRKDKQHLTLSVTLIPVVIDGIVRGAHGIARDLSMVHSTPEGADR